MHCHGSSIQPKILEKSIITMLKLKKLHGRLLLFGNVTTNYYHKPKSKYFILETEETYKNQTQPPAYNPYGSQMGISSPQVLGANPSLNPTRPKEVQVLGADPTVNPTKSVPTEYSSSPVAPTVSAAKQILGANALNPKPQYTRPDVSNLPKEDELYFETKEKAEEAFIQVLVEAVKNIHSFVLITK